jgi:hypothetical protein
MGHTSPNLALRIYAQMMRLSEDGKDQLVALVAGEETAVPFGRARTRAA